MRAAQDMYVPATDVRCIRVDDATMLTMPASGESCTLTATGVELWTLLNDRRRTVDRLVMALARNSSGQALSLIPDVVHQELDTFVRNGFVQRVAAA